MGSFQYNRVRTPFRFSLFLHKIQLILKSKLMHVNTVYKHLTQQLRHDYRYVCHFYKKKKKIIIVTLLILRYLDLFFDFFRYVSHRIVSSSDML